MLSVVSLEQQATHTDCLLACLAIHTAGMRRRGASLDMRADNMCAYLLHETGMSSWAASLDTHTGSIRRRATNTHTHTHTHTHTYTHTQNTHTRTRVTRMLLYLPCACTCECVRTYVCAFFFPASLAFSLYGCVCRVPRSLCVSRSLCRPLCHPRNKENTRKSRR